MGVQRVIISNHNIMPLTVIETSRGTQLSYPMGGYLRHVCHALFDRNSFGFLYHDAGEKACIKLQGTSL